MENLGHPLILGGRVNAAQLARVDAAARLTRQPRAHFIVAATLERAAQVLKAAAAEAPVLADKTA